MLGHGLLPPAPALTPRLRDVTETVGIFGGTFDPPHIGHIAAAQRCRAALGLRRILFVVANDPWQKSPERRISPASERLRLVEIALEGLEGLEVCSLEVERGGPSYTIDTVLELESSEGIVDPWVIVGSDLSKTLETWERPEELRRRVRIAVLSRPGSPLELPEGWRSVAVPSDEIDLSSSEIRAKVGARASIQGLVTPGVMRHIDLQRLYDGRPDASS